MRAWARLAVARDPGTAPGRTTITRLRSDPPLVLRPTVPTGPEPPARWHLAGPATARVALAAGAAGPIGGDRLRLDVEVGAGATLVVRSVAATVVLPGPHGEASRSEVAISVGAGASLVWLPGPVIAARGCRHESTTRVSLAPGSRLFARDELVLGRHGEGAGSIRQRLRVRLDGRPLLDQELHVGPDALGSDGPAVTGGRRAVGATLVVDREWAEAAAFGRAAAAAHGTSARLPLCGPAVLISALAPDVPALRRHLASGLAQLEDDSLPAPDPAPRQASGSKAAR